MAEPTTHEMELVRTHASGAEEWHCPTCGRRFLMHWPPSYKKIVIEPGDEFVAHIGGRGASELRAALSGVQHTSHNHEPAPAMNWTMPHEEVGPVPITAELLPWLRWMRSAGLATSEA